MGVKRFAIDSGVTPLLGASPKHDGFPAVRFRHPFPAIWTPNLFARRPHTCLCQLSSTLLSSCVAVWMYRML